MDKDIASEWLKALRSGKYMQGEGMLRSNCEKYCCLGVLCDISNLDKWDREMTSRFAYTGSSYLLPDSVVAWAGLSRGSVDYSSQLVIMNDGGKTFEEIANFIEQIWEIL